MACGDWCRFCKAKAACRKRAEYNLELAKYDFEMPDTLEDAEIAAILDKVDELTAWAADVKEYALRQALSGTEYPGYKVVEGAPTAGISARMQWPMLFPRQDTTLR